MPATESNRGMIAVLDDFQGGAAPPLHPGTSAIVSFTDVPAAAVPQLRALLAVAHTAARVRRIAIRAISRGKPARFVIPLLRAHERLVKEQAALAEAVATVLAAAT